MIGRLSGVLLESRPDHVLVDVGGVGYEVSVPLGTYTALPPPGERVTLHVHTHVREDALLLFGFSTPEERRLFERLLSVSGIGPRVALTVLSGLPLPELVAAIAAQDARRLATIPGVGKKLAERLGLELKEKLSDLVPGPPARGAVPRTSAAGDAVEALLNLGYRPAQAEAAVAAASREADEHDLSALLQAALRSLAR
ncbi:Holliday junction branch migration protein RuvA [Acidobacteria bacterium ACD]|nr:MAG: Holliday junction branch migration protein RuvA [Acidobacteriota bacterium]MDL1951750.1 Holliday junction branch migration protein RuvA [Acidobacteria bacterium ACD]